MKPMPQSLVVQEEAQPLTILVISSFFPNDVSGNRRRDVASGGDDELILGRQQVAVLPEAAAEFEQGVTTE
jgi:hypothetical protein